MFPNVRLIVVAMLASMASICCCLGVFAAFRVNHEPFTRAQSSNPPLQLVFGNGAPAVATDAAVAPFGVRFALNAPPVIRPIPTPAAVDHPVADTMAPDAAGTDASPTANEAAKQDNGKDAAREVAVEAPAEPSAPPAAKDVQTAPDSTAAVDSKTEVSTDAKTDTSTGSSADTKTETSTSSPADTKTETSTGTIVKTDTAIDAKPDVKPDTKPVADTAPKTAATPARKDVRRRVARVRRFRRPQAATALPALDLNFALAPNYQVLPQAAAQTAPAPPAVRRRVATKRHRPAKAAAVKQRTVPKKTVVGRSTGPISR